MAGEVVRLRIGGRKLRPGQSTWFYDRLIPIVSEIPVHAVDAEGAPVYDEDFTPLVIGHEDKVTGYGIRAGLEYGDEVSSVEVHDWESYVRRGLMTVIEDATPAPAPTPPKAKTESRKPPTEEAEAKSDSK